MTADRMIASERLSGLIKIGLLTEEELVTAQNASAARDVELESKEKQGGAYTNGHDLPGKLTPFCGQDVQQTHSRKTAGYCKPSGSIVVQKKLIYSE